VTLNQLEGVMSFEKKEHQEDTVLFEWEFTVLSFLFIVGLDSLWRLIKWM